MEVTLLGMVMVRMLNSLHRPFMPMATFSPSSIAVTQPPYGWL